MDVMEASPTVSDCFPDIDVVWGTNGDTIAFSYNAKVVKFWKVRMNHQQKLLMKTLNESKNGDYLMLTNYWGELWVARMVTGKAGMAFFLNELHDRKRYLLFDYTEVEICN